MTSLEGVQQPITGGEKGTAWILLAFAVAANAAGYLLNWFGRIAWYDVARGNVIMGKRDTILDLICDSTGALAAGVVALAMARD